MGDKEFHEMLGILCDYDDLVNEFTQADDRQNGLTNLARKHGISLDEADIRDLLKGLDGIIKMKSKGSNCFYASPRN
jgi:hypothetical protein